MKRLLPLIFALALAACGESANDAAAPAADAPAADTAATAAPAEATAADAPDVIETRVEDMAADEAAETSADEAAPAEAATDAEAAAEAPRPAPPVVDPAKVPRLGTDYEPLAEPMPTIGQGGIEVAEVFSYMCIHCANLQPVLNTWKSDLPADVRFEYVPGVFGGASDNFARAYYAAEVMNLVDKTHDDLFKAVLIERKFTSASPEEIADWYAGYGADREAFLSTMQSIAVTAKFNRARQFALRGGVDATPMIIVNGKYRAMATADRGMEGLLDTVDWLVAHERAGSTP
ncbi:thiol:disulfide interchange protein DsbA/DsbL [Arenimonas sp.]|uniref:thiol:disulfide interchange protein DsbA/DsbL n=1 Tax=Arenimonas sp. TaxID=1872635 RepID=UPI0035B47E4A